MKLHATEAFDSRDCAAPNCTHEAEFASGLCRHCHEARGRPRVPIAAPPAPTIRRYTPGRPTCHGKTQQAILRALSHGRPVGKTELRATVGISDDQLSITLYRLKVHGAVRNPARGVYQITSDGVAAIVELEAEAA